MLTSHLFSGVHIVFECIINSPAIVPLDPNQACYHSAQTWKMIMEHNSTRLTHLVYNPITDYLNAQL